MNMLLGVILSVFGGGIQGAFVFPQKFTNGWKYENGWFVFTLTCCLIFPLILAFATIPDLMGLYRSIPASTIWLVFFSGMAWGVGVILYGLGAKYLGMAIGIPLITALNAAFGTLFPLFLLPGEAMSSHAVMILVAGLAVLICGVIWVARAGAIRDRDENKPQTPRKVSFRTGLLVCLVAAIFCPATNFAVFFGQPITRAVVEAGGVSAINAGYAQLLPYFLGGFIVNCIYCVWLFVKNRSFKLYFATPRGGRNLLLGGSMSVLFLVGMVLYTIATTLYIKDVGTVLGWPLFMAATIMAGIVLGLLSGEWKKVAKRAFKVLYTGIALLILAIVIVSLSNLF